MRVQMTPKVGMLTFCNKEPALAAKKPQRIIAWSHVQKRLYVDPILLCRLYIFLVRPILEYACQVWDPYTHTNIDKLESVQKFALKVCTHCWNIDYDMLLNMFQLPCLSARREYL